MFNWLKQMAVRASLHTFLCTFCTYHRVLYYYLATVVGVPLLYDAVFTHVHACVHVAIPFIFMYRRRFEEEQEVYVCVADSLPPDLTDLAFRLHL